MQTPQTVKRHLGGAWLASMIVMLAGCSLLTADYQNIKEPKVALAGLNVKDLNPLKPTFLVRLKVDNPNDLDVNLDGADVALALNGQPVATGVSLSPLTLKKLGSSTMDVEVTANTLSAIQQFLVLQSKPAMDYQVTGHLNWLNWLGALGKLPFNFNGSVDRATLMSAASSLAK
jgi:LEA14-like dessication related protein